MIIESLRLKNIKSYGEGPDGSGITIRLERGVNRVAGRNGHGKSTLIESIGYALFFTEPQFEENFQIETYLLSHGAKEGEIDVTFSSEGQSYRIERIIGKQTKRRSKVIQVGDQSICAEGDQEVSAFLCRLLAFPDQKQLTEVFCKLVGVKQGRLVWPFDSGPTEAKRYFEPLLEVDVFRNCFDRLKGAVDTFQAQKSEHLTKQAGINERLRERANSPAALASSQQQVAETAAALATVVLSRDAALKLREQLELLAKSVETSHIALTSASQKAMHTKQLREAGDAQLAEAKSAVQILMENEPAHQAHAKALQTLGLLEQQREQRDRLKEQRDQAETDRSSRQSKAVAAREQAKEFRLQRDGKQQECEALAGKIKPVQIALEASLVAYRTAAAAAEAAQDHRDTVSRWIDGLCTLAKSQKRNADIVIQLSQEISTWDNAKLKSAEIAEAEAAGLLKAVRDRLAKAEQRLATLKEQLKEISGGICPFLKEQCRQFDPAKVQADLEQQSSVLAVVENQATAAQIAQQKAGLTLGDLRTAYVKIASKESDLQDALTHYREELCSLNSEVAAAALQWLLVWAEFPAPPVAPTPPVDKLESTAVVRLQAQLETFVSEAEAWWEKFDDTIKARLKAFHEEEKNRKVQEAGLSQFSNQLSQLQKEFQSFSEKAAAKDSEARQQDEPLAALVTQLGKLDDALKSFASLETDIKREQQIRDRNRLGHERYLGAKKLADDLPSRQTRLTQLESDETAAEQALQEATKKLQMAEKDFDPEKLKAALADHQTKHDHATTLKVSLEVQQSNLTAEHKRFEEWQAAGQELDRLAVEIGRCEAAIELTELARKTLRDTAPAVAQHLCNRIATRAQGVFNQINPDPIKLAWSSERYSLRVAPGDRRFAMLSGGEQTKLALAMTLAMIQEFSGLRFCIFDEPTYGVDADSRHKLADAILQAQEAAELDQLLLVSHDDAFEGKIEHSVLLEKSAASGTKVILSQ